jgi:hypothetical protein
MCNGCTPLHLSVKANDLAAVRFFVESLRADVNELRDLEGTEDGNFFYTLNVFFRF